RVAAGGFRVERAIWRGITRVSHLLGRRPVAPARPCRAFGRSSVHCGPAATAVVADAGMVVVAVDDRLVVVGVVDVPADRPHRSVIAEAAAGPNAADETGAEVT